MFELKKNKWKVITEVFYQFQKNCVAFVDAFTYQRLHHVGFAVAQSFDGVEDVHHVLVLDHFEEDVAGAEAPATTTPVAAEESMLLKKRLRRRCEVNLGFD